MFHFYYLIKVVNGINYRLNIELADALNCLNDNVTSTLDECPADLNTVRHTSTLTRLHIYLIS